MVHDEDESSSESDHEAAKAEALLFNYGGSSLANLGNSSLSNLKQSISNIKHSSLSDIAGERGVAPSLSFVTSNTEATSDVSDDESTVDNCSDGYDSVDLSLEERRALALECYQKLAKPSRFTLYGLAQHYKVNAKGGVPVTKADIDLLPWNNDNTRVLDEFDPAKNRKERALHWYTCLAKPTHTTMNKCLQKTHGMDISSSDIDLLNWNSDKTAVLPDPNEGDELIERKQKALEWYKNLGEPRREVMYKVSEETVGMNVAKEDIDLLNWNKDHTKVLDEGSGSKHLQLKAHGHFLKKQNSKKLPNVSKPKNEVNDAAKRSTGSAALTTRKQPATGKSVNSTQAQKTGQLQANRAAEEKTEKTKQDKASKESQDRIKKASQEKAKRVAVEKAEKEGKEKTRKLEEEKRKKLSRETAKNEDINKTMEVSKAVSNTKNGLAADSTKQVSEVKPQQVSTFSTEALDKARQEAREEREEANERARMAVQPARRIARFQVESNKAKEFEDDDQERRERDRAERMLMFRRSLSVGPAVFRKAAEEEEKEEKKQKELTPEQQKEKEQREFLMKIYSWWGRLGQPNRKNFKRRISELKQSGIKPDDIDDLPWSFDGGTVMVNRMNKLITAGLVK